MSPLPAAATAASAIAHRQPYRWVVLTVFLLVAGYSQAVWLNFAALLTDIQLRYHVREDLAALLILVFPALYVLLSLPAGLVIDRHGYRRTLRLVTLATACFSLMRVVDGGFAWLLAAQVGLAACQPFVINVISKLVLDWYPPEQRALATGLGTMGMFIGMALGLALTPIAVEAWGFSGAMAGFAACAIALCLACFALVRDNPCAPPARPQPGLRACVRPLLADRALLLLFALAALGLGYFNGITTWLEPILAPNGLDSVQAGVAGGVLILGGIVGAALIPALSDLARRRKPFVIASVLAAALTLWPALRSDDYLTVLIACALQGLCFLPAYALLLEMCSERAGETLAGSATSILMLCGNAGGVLVVLAMVAVKGDDGSWAPAVALLFGLLVVSALGALCLPETYPRAPPPPRPPRPPQTPRRPVMAR